MKMIFICIRLHSSIAKVKEAADPEGRRLVFHTLNYCRCLAGVIEHDIAECLHAYVEAAVVNDEIRRVVCRL